jgi:ribosomal protein S18 acetylase RimI-like enzyme
MTTWHFAVAVEADLPACAAIAGTSELFARYGRDTAAALASLEGAHQDPGAEILVARLGETIAGFAWVVERGGFDRAAYLRLIAVAETQRGRGVGAGIIAELERRHGGSGLFLLVSDFNQAAQRFYQRLGYRQVGTIESFAHPDIDELIYYKPPPA